MHFTWTKTCHKRMMLRIVIHEKEGGREARRKMFTLDEELRTKDRIIKTSCEVLDFTPSNYCIIP